MARATLRLTADTTHCEEVLAALAEAAERFPEFRDALVDFLESGQELFLLDSDGIPATVTGEFVVRLYPSDALVGFVTAFRARNSDFYFLKHVIPSTGPNSTTDDGATQC